MKNSKLFALAGLGALVAVGGTFAYYNTTQTFNNPFTTTEYGTYVTEHFNVDDGSEWKPGATVAKEIIATNTGDGKVWVRVKFDEQWYRYNDGEKSIFKEITSGNDKFNPTGTTDSAGKPLAGSEYQPGTTIVDGKTVYNGNTDGLTDADGSVVYKKLENVTTTSSELGKWFKSGDYYYYTSALKNNESSAVLLNGVTLCADTDMGETAHKAAYIVLPKNTDRVKVPSFLEDMDTTEAGVQFQEGGNSYDWVVCQDETELPKPMAKPAADASPEDKKAYEDYKAAFGGKDIYTYKSEELTGNKGYAGANYQLDITVELVQADEEKTAAKSLDWDLKALNYASKPKKESETP